MDTAAILANASESTMHQTSFTAMECLLQKLLPSIAQSPINVLDVGSMVAEDGQASYRNIVDRFAIARYTGLDMAAGKNVDIVSEDPYKFPLESESFDLVLSGQAFEHIEFPWLTICEIARVLRPGGSAIVIAPSSGLEHRYPQDCWRYYPDGMRALAKWAGLECIDAMTNWEETKRFMWGDTIGIFYKRGSPVGSPNLSPIDTNDLQQVRKIWVRLLSPPDDAQQSVRKRLYRALDRHILWRLKG
jgi:SAM-dependent methyltransferase